MISCAQVKRTKPSEAEAKPSARCGYVQQEASEQAIASEAEAKPSARNVGFTVGSRRAAGAGEQAKASESEAKPGAGGSAFTIVTLTQQARESRRS